MSLCVEVEGFPPLCADFSHSPTTPISPIPKTYPSIAITGSMNLFFALFHFFLRLL